MFRRHLTSIALTGAVIAAAFTVSLVADQQAKPMPGHDMGAMRGEMTMKSTMTRAQKIANAVTAGPAAISANATVYDWPAKEGARPEVLRAGTNGWSCLPDFPDSKGNDPLCVDDVWMKWFDAYLSHKTPDVTKVGIGYMQAPGGAWASNSDPYAMKETADNHWGHHQPHIMILVPDPKALAGISTDPKNGGPYVMYAGTPYAHIMAPTVAPGMHK